MTKAEAISHFKNASELAQKLGITRSAVSQWPEDADIPREQELRIRYEILPAMAAEATEPEGQAKAA